MAVGDRAVRDIDEHPLGAAEAEPVDHVEHVQGES
jgi:hypothetical protein